MKTRATIGKSTAKAFTLIEVMTAMFIFTLMLTAMVGVFATLMKKHSEVKKMQQQTEEFSLAMSYMAKKIRMSTLVAVSDCGGPPCSAHNYNIGSDAGFITILDHATETQTTFAFDAVNHTLTETLAGAASASLIVSDVAGGFRVDGWNNGSSPPSVTLHMMPVGLPASSVQTSVSMRSY